MKRVINFFIPKEDIFFDLLKNQAKTVCQTSTIFGRFLRDFDELSVKQKKKKMNEINEMEHKADDLTHEMVALLHKSFITPIDREDIHQLADLLDDLVDVIDDVSNKLVQYELKKIPEDLFDLSVVGLKSLNEVFEAVSCLKKPNSINVHLRRIHDFEDEGDRIYNKAISDLFKKEKNAIKLIKLRDIYREMEDLLDKAQKIAIVIEGIVVKHA